MCVWCVCVFGGREREREREREERNSVGLGVCMCCQALRSALNYVLPPLGTFAVYCEMRCFIFSSLIKSSTLSRLSTAERAPVAASRRAGRHEVIQRELAAGKQFSLVGEEGKIPFYLRAIACLAFVVYDSAGVTQERRKDWREKRL